MTVTKRKPIRHGTPAGADAHRRRGETPCADCLTASRTYRRAATTRRATPRVVAELTQTLTQLGPG